MAGNGQKNLYLVISVRKMKEFKRTYSSFAGGVCGGLGRYFEIDPIIFRLIFVVSFLSFGVGILPYLVIWFITEEE